MLDVSSEILIRRQRNDVAEFAANPDNAPLWYENIRSAEWITQPPLKEGSKILFRASFLGRELSYVYEITKYVPGQLLVMQTAEGPFPMETVYEWEAIDGATTCMVLTNRGNPGGFFKWLSPLLKTAMQSANRKDLLKLKSLLEERIAIESLVH